MNEKILRVVERLEQLVIIALSLGYYLIKLGLREKREDKRKQREH